MVLLTRTYSELIKFDNFADRFNYLKLGGFVGEETFGYDRWLNQVLYHSDEWHRTRNFVIVRDNGCDLGIPGLEVRSHLIVHHMNPLTKLDVLEHSDDIFNPEYLICTCMNTHNAIHYGEDLTSKMWKAREAGDTRLW